MRFGHCKVCRDYKRLVHRGACEEHVEISDISVQVSVVDGFYNAQAISEFSGTIADDPRLSASDDGKTITLSLSDMEVIIRDEGQNVIQKYEYDNKNEISKKTKKAINWVVNNS